MLVNAGDFDSKKSTIAINDATEFLGYELFDNAATVKSIIRNNKSVSSVNKGEEAIIVLDKSSFYGESGGQSGDHGTISKKDSQFLKLSDTQRQASNAFEHYGVQSKGSLKVGDKIEARIDQQRRKKIMNNHSATHLLHEALRQILGRSSSAKRILS